MNNDLYQMNDDSYQMNNDLYHMNNDLSDRKRANTSIGASRGSSRMREVLLERPRVLFDRGEERRDGTPSKATTIYTT